MELHQLEYFVAVAEEANFTRAAERLHVAQPGVSAQVRRLERELGQELLDRSGRKVTLTAVGAAVLPYARAALGAVSGARHAVDELTGLVRGRIAVGTVTSHNVPFPELLADFHDEHPAVDITLGEDSSDRLIEAVRTGRLDAAIVAIGPTTPSGLDIHVLTDQAVCAAVCLSHQLARRASMPLAALRDRPLIALPRGTGIRTVLDDACAGLGFTPYVAFEAGTPMVLAQLAARGLGVAILPESVAYNREDLHPIDLTRPAIRGRLAFAWRAGGPTSPAARAFIARARRTLS
ncbi:LysR family transcriptional regulator [Fodinicola acaciae]|uniref:LysR family transcriptional regulator n=1 Tax=Fodinicola acaciae TaxID=2681555 RepID=UPI0013D537CA|nr:LysR family transcriptional regulator [Fodinicola acaciae]